MANILGYYHIPSGLPKEVCKIIEKEYLHEKLHDSCVTGKDGMNGLVQEHQFRKSKQLWLSTDSWIAGMMAHFIHCANDNYFNFDISSWADKIQYTVYDEPGSHYRWHFDTRPSVFNQNFIRKLSISLLISDSSDFDGGQLQIMVGNNEMITIDMNIGDAVIFPSDAMHRVRPITKGKRISLVGWFGGPPFR